MNFHSHIRVFDWLNQSMTVRLLLPKKASSVSHHQHVHIQMFSFIALKTARQDNTETMIAWVLVIADHDCNVLHGWKWKKNPIIGFYSILHSTDPLDSQLLHRYQTYLKHLCCWIRVEVLSSSFVHGSSFSWKQIITNHERASEIRQNELRSHLYGVKI